MEGAWQGPREAPRVLAFGRTQAAQILASGLTWPVMRPHRTRVELKSTGSGSSLALSERASSDVVEGGLGLRG